jgi:DNA-nicking Smr family endonuclease
LSAKISNKDKKDWDKFTSSKEKLPNKDFKNQKKSFFKSRTIDLHGFTLEQANSSIENFIKESYEDKINRLIIVTGKGLHSQNENDPYVSKDLSILKFSVPEFIKNNNDLMKIIYDFGKANIEDGGEGAFYIYLKKNNIKKK